MPHQYPHADVEPHVASFTWLDRGGDRLFRLCGCTDLVSTSRFIHIEVATRHGFPDLEAVHFDCRLNGRPNKLTEAVKIDARVIRGDGRFSGMDCLECGSAGCASGDKRKQRAYNPGARHGPSKKFWGP